MIEQPPSAEERPESAESAGGLRVVGKRAVGLLGSNFGTIFTGNITLQYLSPRARAGLALVLAILVVAAFIVIFQFAIRPLIEPQPEMIGGSIKIAVGGFDGVDASGKPVDARRTDDLAQAVYQRLTDVARGSGKPSSVIWTVGQTGHVTGANAQSRASAIKADVLIYGTLRVTQDATHLQPHFYVTTNQLIDAEELAGDYRLGQEIVSLDDFSRNSATYDDLSNKLSDRVVSLEDMLYGLAHYRRDELTEAATSFKSAETSRSWQGTDGKEILLLFSGFTAGKLQDLPAAAAYFSQAATLDRTRARAHLGTAEVLLEQSGTQQDCSTNAVDVATLHTAAAQFQAALADPSPPPLANIPAKAHYGLGQVDLCLSQSGLEDDWTDATQNFQAVIAAYQAGDSALKSQAADSHAALGFIDQPFTGETDPATTAAAWTAAASEYRQAVELGGESHPSRRAFFDWSLGVAEEHLGDLDAAEQAYASAADVAELDAQTRSVYEQARDRVHTARATDGHAE